MSPVGRLPLAPLVMGIPLCAALKKGTVPTSTTVALRHQNRDCPLVRVGTVRLAARKGTPDLGLAGGLKTGLSPFPPRHPSPRGMKTGTVPISEWGLSPLSPPCRLTLRLERGLSPFPPRWA